MLERKYKEPGRKNSVRKSKDAECKSHVSVNKSKDR